MQLESKNVVKVILNIIGIQPFEMDRNIFKVFFCEKGPKINKKINVFIKKTEFYQQNEKCFRSLASLTQVSGTASSDVGRFQGDRHTFSALHLPLKKRNEYRYSN